MVLLLFCKRVLKLWYVKIIIYLCKKNVGWCMCLCVCVVEMGWELVLSRYGNSMRLPLRKTSIELIDNGIPSFLFPPPTRWIYVCFRYSVPLFWSFRSFYSQRMLMYFSWSMQCISQKTSITVLTSLGRILPHSMLLVAFLDLQRYRSHLIQSHRWIR